MKTDPEKTVDLSQEALKRLRRKDLIAIRKSTRICCICSQYFISEDKTQTVCDTCVEKAFRKEFGYFPK